MDYKIPRLKKGAVPSVFPNCPKYLSKPAPRRRVLSERKMPSNSTNSNTCEASDIFSSTKIDHIPDDSVVMDIENCEGSINQSAPSNIMSSEEDIHQPSPSNFAPENTELTESERCVLFDSLFSDKSSFNLPTAWLRYDIVNADFRAIEFSECTGRLKGNQIITVHHKKIVLYKDMRAQVFVMDCLLENNTVGLAETHVSSTVEIENAMGALHKLKICQGCASSSFVCNSKNTFTFQDALGTLRHNKCSLILDVNAKQNSKCCQNCKKAKITLSKKLLRLQRQKHVQRIVLKLSPERKKKLQRLNQKLNTTHKQKIRLNARRDFLKKQLGKVKNKLNSLNNISIDNELKNLDIPKNEQTVILEIIKAAKCNDAKGRRYSDDWIMLSLLFHMRSPKAYRMLRDTNVLPLPCISTIRR